MKEKKCTELGIRSKIVNLSDKILAIRKQLVDIENVLKGAMATGNWGIKNNNNKQGVSQVLNRLTFMSSISHLRRVSTPVDNTGKLIPPRKLHSSQWGYICPVETPEGQSVGVVKNLSLMCEITTTIPSDFIYEIFLGLLDFKSTIFKTLRGFKTIVDDLIAKRKVA